MKNFFKGIGLFAATVCYAASLNAAVSQRTKIQKSDIAEIIKNDVKNNTMIVKTRDGRKFQLKVTAEQRADIENALKVASADNKVAMKAITSTASATTSSTSAASTAPAAGQTATTVADATKDEKKSPWGVGYFGWYIGNDLNKMHDMTGTWNIRHYFTVSYALDSGIKLSVRPRLDTNYNLEEGNTKNDLKDTGFGISKGGFKLPGDIGLSLDGRYYAPTSKKSRDDGQNGYLYGKAVGAKDMNKVVSLSYTLLGLYNFQGNRSLTSFDDVGRVISSKGVSQGMFIHGLTVEEKVTDKWSFSQDIGFTHNSIYDDPGVGIEGGLETSLDLGIGTNYQFTKGFSLGLAMGQSHELGEGEGKGIKLTDAERTNYQILVSITLL